MRIVKEAARIPHHCVVYPHLGAKQVEGYVDTGNDLTCIDPHIYLSVVAVREMAKLIGLPDAQEHEAAVARVEQLERDLDEARSALAEADRLIEAIDVIESRDFRARKKPGRPRKNDSEGVG